MFMYSSVALKLTIQQGVSRAEQLLQMGNVVEASTLLRQLISADTLHSSPGSMFARQMLGMILLQHGSHNSLLSKDPVQEGLTFLSSAVQLSPNHVQLRYNYALALLNSSQTIDSDIRALKEFQYVISLAPNTVIEAYYKSAQITNKLKRNSETIYLLEKAIELQPQRPHAYIYSGDVFNNMKRFDKAIKHYTIGIKLIEQYRTNETNTNPNPNTKQVKID